MLNGDYEAECIENVIFVYKHTWRNCGKTSNTIQVKHAHQTFVEWRKIPKTLLWFILYINFYVVMCIQNSLVYHKYTLPQRNGMKIENKKKRSKINGKQVKKKENL